ncbi:MAG TPA: zf-HC2 domain-containing protein, partial [Thermodesulfovibrionales bacterium]|nr:zf-HC2 domain-containing protein [Thermodesulfovibrionales bacterium]
MECRDIRDQLSEYLDNALSPREKVAIDEHLKSCGECATALGDLKRAIEHLKHLEEVETPAWMTGRIMTRVRGEAQPKKGLLQKLSYPLYRKLPVGAIATAAIALSTLYIFRAIEPEIKLASAPMQETATQPPLREGLHSQGGPEADNVVPISPPSAKESEGAPGEKKREPSQRAEHAAPLGEPAFLGDRREAPEVPAPRKQEKPLREQRTPAPAS